MNETTRLFTEEEITDALVEQMLKEVYSALEEKGYDPTKQIVGYLITNDPGYISSYNGARTKIKMLDRTKIIEILLNKYIGENK
jgi:uncharacterized protein (UPF0297 family)